MHFVNAENFLISNFRIIILEICGKERFSIRQEICLIVYNKIIYFQESLHTLDISFNDILFLHQGTFGKNNILQLHVNNNKLSRIPLEALSSTMASLHLLDLAHNNIKLEEL